LYRLARILKSSVPNQCSKNGKKVIVQIELQARFDEASNISYAEQKTEGIELIFGVKLKVHSKMCVIERIEGGKVKRYGFYINWKF
jgi:polyphosphate kinase